MNQNNNIIRTIIVTRPPILLPLPYPIQRQRNNNREISSNSIKSVYAERPSINSGQMKETILQNLIQVKNMIEFGNYNDFKENNNGNKEYDMNCFNLDKRILEKGQWIDVKDTVNKWLEAQVMEVSEDKKKVKIHYNNWGDKWDEWINTNSQRIMPFRYHTRQMSLTNYNSPFPNEKFNSNISLLSFNNNSDKNENNILQNIEEKGIIEILNEFNKINQVISGLSTSLLSEYNSNNNNITENQKKFYYNLKRLIPIFDRFGRIYSDISTFFDDLMRKNCIELISKNLFKNKNNIHEDLKFFSFEERTKINKAILSKYSESENKNGTLNFVSPINNFDAKLINYIPNIDTPLLISKKDININQNNSNSNSNNINYLRNIQSVNFNLEYKKKEENVNNTLGRKTKRENINIKNDNNIKNDDLNNKKKK